MTDQAFNALTDEQLFDGFKHCCASALAHEECAETLEQKQLYGLANSHLILGVEEAIKGILLLNKLCRVPLAINSITPYFKFHKDKHHKGKSLSFDLENTPIIPDLPIALAAILGYVSKKLSNKDLLKIGLEFALIRPLDNEWWVKANNGKNEGFYVDYNNGKWKTPTDISAQEYQQSRQQTKRLFGYLTLFGKLIDRKDLQYLPLSE